MEDDLTVKQWIACHPDIVLELEQQAVVRRDKVKEAALAAVIRKAAEQIRTTTMRDVHSVADQIRTVMDWDGR